MLESRASDAPSKEERAASLIRLGSRGQTQARVRRARSGRLRAGARSVAGQLGGDELSLRALLEDRAVGPPRRALRRSAARRRRQGRRRSGHRLSDRHGQLANAQDAPSSPSRTSTGCDVSSLRTPACSRSSASSAAKATIERACFTILTDAQRSLADGPDKTSLATEIAKLAEAGANAQKAIDQYKTILRHDPTNQEARQSLKRLYTQTEGWNALIELLRQDLERTPADDKTARLKVLREIASVYRDRIKSDTALVTVLTQIVQLDGEDIESLRELVRVYEALGRWRDLLQHQSTLAGLLPQGEEKAELFRSVAKRWLEQFSNVQNATDAYESLLAAAPGDEEAISKLKELYAKRRAWAPLYALFEKQAEAASGKARIDLLGEMAKLAAERLDRGADAIKIYKAILDEDPARGRRARSPGATGRSRQGFRDRGVVARASPRDRRQRSGSARGSFTSSAAFTPIVWPTMRAPPRRGGACSRSNRGTPRRCACCATRTSPATISTASKSSMPRRTTGRGWPRCSPPRPIAPPSRKRRSISRSAPRGFSPTSSAPKSEPSARTSAFFRCVPTTPRAAAALVQIYETEEKWSRLPALYEILLTAAQEDDQKLELLHRLVDVTGQKLGERAAAVQWAFKAYDLAPSEERLDELEEASRAAKSWELYVDAVTARLKKKKGVSNKDRRTLKAKLARLHATELGRLDDAISEYKTLVEEEPSDEEAVSALDKLLRSEDRRDDLRWLFELRATQGAEDSRAVDPHRVGEPRARRVRRALARDRSLSTRPRSRCHQRAGGPHVAPLAPGRRKRARGRRGHRSAPREDRRRRARRTRARPRRHLSRSPLQTGTSAQGRSARAQGRAARPARGGLARSAASRCPRPAPRPPSCSSRSTPNRAILGAERKRSACCWRRAPMPNAGSSSIPLSPSSKSTSSRRPDARSKSCSAPSPSSPPRSRFGIAPASSPCAPARPTDLAEAYRGSRCARNANLPAAIEIELCERAAALHDEKLGDPEARHARTSSASSQRSRATSAPSPTEADPHQRREMGRARGALRRKPSRARPTPSAASICSTRSPSSAKRSSTSRTRPSATTRASSSSIDARERDPRAREALRARRQRYEKLAALLEQRLENATQAETVALKLRLGQIDLDQLHDPARALATSRTCCGSTSEIPGGRELVERMLEIGSLRPRAAEVLEAVYDARDEVRDLVRVLEIRLEGAEEDDLRRELLRRIASLRDERLQDDGGAFDTLARLVPLDPPTSRRAIAWPRSADASASTSGWPACSLKRPRRRKSRASRSDILMQLAELCETMLGDLGARRGGLQVGARHRSQRPRARVAARPGPRAALLRRPATTRRWPISSEARWRSRRTWIAAASSSGASAGSRRPCSKIPQAPSRRGDSASRTSRRTSAP